MKPEIKSLLLYHNVGITRKLLKYESRDLAGFLPKEGELAVGGINQNL